MQYGTVCNNKTSLKKEMSEEAAFERKSADGEFISSDMAPADNWSQCSPSSENSQVECSSEKIDQSVNPFAPEA